MDDIRSICLEEISLEGLDGITFSTLWFRLSDRKDGFPFTLDESTYDFIWKTFALHDELEFYELPENRPVLKGDTNFTRLDTDTGLPYDDGDDVDLYPNAPINDNGIRGSCATYKVRKNVSSDVRDLDTLKVKQFDEIRNKYGEKLVIVASQTMRNIALIGPGKDPATDIPERCYCTLERVARSRYNGETTHGKSGLKLLQESSKTLHFIRKKLYKLNLITTQSFTLKSGNKPIVGRLVHLTRFYSKYTNKYVYLLEKLTGVLAKKPEKKGLYEIIRAETHEAMEEIGFEFKNRVFQRLVQQAVNYVTRADVPAAEYYTNASEDELNYLIQECKTVKVITLIKQFHAGDHNQTVDIKAEEDEEKEDEDDYDDDPLPELMFEPLIERSLMEHCFAYMWSKGKEGVVERDLVRDFGVPRSQARMLIKNFTRLKLVKTMWQDRGKQFIYTYFLNEFVKQSDNYSKTIQQQQKVTKFGMAKDEVNDLEAIHQTPSFAERDSESSQSPVKKKKVPYSVEIMNKRMDLSYRQLRRQALILDTLKQHKLIQNTKYLQYKIIEEEKKEGIKATIDKKSLTRLLERMAGKGLITLVQSILNVGASTRTISVVALPSIKSSDPIIIKEIELAKKSLTRSVDATTPFKEPQTSNLNFLSHTLLSSTVPAKEMVYDAQYGVVLGFESRMNRCKIVHEILWHILHVLQEPCDEVVEWNVDNSKWEKSKLPEEELIAKLLSEGDEIVSKAKVYHNEMTFKRFMPRCAKPLGYPHGWLLVADVLLILPICLIVKITRVTHKVPALKEFLACPFKRLLTLSQLPNYMRQMLVYKRRVISGICSNISHLAALGLLHFGEQRLKTNDQVYIYCCRYATIIDTAGPFCRDWTEEEYLEVVKEKDQKLFDFNNKAQIDNYWFELRCICLNTDQAIMKFCIKNEKMYPQGKGERFHYTMTAKSPEEIVDDGMIPGNKLGAGGLDSIHFANLVRNWSKSGAHGGMTKRTETEKQSKANRVTQSLKGKEMNKTQGKKRNVEDKDKAGSKRRKQKRVRNTGSDTASEAFQHNPLQKVLPPGIKKGTLKPEPATSQPRRGPGSMTPANKYLKPKKVMTARLQSQIRDNARKKMIEVATRTLIKRQKRKPTDSNSTPYVKRVYDEKDMEAMKRMSKERVNWTQEEDCFLLLVLVVDKFLIGHKRTRMINYSEIRDIMHAKFPQSLDKTSKACCRRMMYMMKRAATSYNVNIIIAEAMQDKKLLKFRRKRWITSKRNAAKNTVVFKKVLSLFEKKFQDLERTPMLFLPDTLEDVLKRYSITRQVAVSAVTRHTDATDTDTILTSVCHNLIHASMTLPKKTDYAYTIYLLLREFPDVLLRRVCHQMNQDGIIARSKAVYRDTKRRDMNMLSIGVFSMAQRYSYNWFIRYPRQLFFKTACHLRDLVVANESENLMSKTDTTASAATLENEKGHESMPRGKVPKRNEPVGVNKATATCKTDGSVKDGVPTSEQSLSDPSQLTDELLVLNNPLNKPWEVKDILEKAGKGDVMSTNVKSSMCSSNSSQSSTFIDFDDSGSKCALMTSLMALDKMKFDILIPETILTIKSIKPSKSVKQKKLEEFGLGSKSDEEEEAAIEEAVRHREMKDDDQESNKFYMPGRATLLKNRQGRMATRNIFINYRMLSADDCITLNPCKVRGYITDGCVTKNIPSIEKGQPNHKIEKILTEYNHSKSEIHPKTMYHLLRILRKIEPNRLNTDAFWEAIKDQGTVSEIDQKLMIDLFACIEDAGQLGMTTKQLKAKFPAMAKLTVYLLVLVELHMVLRLGVTVMRYVAHTHAEFWVINSYKNLKGRSIKKDEDLPKLYDIGAVLSDDSVEPFISENALDCEQLTAPSYKIGSPLDDQNRELSFPLMDAKSEEFLVKTLTNKGSRISIEQSLQAVDSQTNDADDKNEEDKVIMGSGKDVTLSTTEEADIATLANVISLGDCPLEEGHILDLEISHGDSPQVSVLEHQSATHSAPCNEGVIGTASTSVVDPLKQVSTSATRKCQLSGTKSKLGAKVLRPKRTTNKKSVADSDLKNTAPTSLSTDELQGEIGTPPTPSPRAFGKRRKTAISGPTLGKPNIIDGTKDQSLSLKLTTEQARLAAKQDTHLGVLGRVLTNELSSPEKKVMHRGKRKANPSKEEASLVRKVVIADNKSPDITAQSKSLLPRSILSSGIASHISTGQTTTVPVISAAKSKSVTSTHSVSPSFSSPVVPNDPSLPKLVIHPDSGPVNIDSNMLNQIQQALKAANLSGGGAQQMQIRLPIGAGQAANAPPVNIKVLSVEQAQQLGIPVKMTSSNEKTKSHKQQESTSQSGTKQHKAEQQFSNTEDGNIPQVDGPTDDKPTSKKRKLSGDQKDLGEGGSQKSTNSGNNFENWVVPGRSPGRRTHRAVEQVEEYKLYQKSWTSGGPHQPVKFVIRPWRAPDGTINRQTLSYMLEAVLAHIMTHPGLNQENLFRKYNPVLQPVAVIELLEMLEILGCIKRQTILASHKAGPFTPRQTFTLSGKVTDSDEVLLVPTVDCLVKLGQLQLQLQS